MNVALYPDIADGPDAMGLRTISICTGGGGLDLGFELAFPGSRAVCLVEREAFAVAHLVAAMRAGLMAPAPVWSDARTFDGRPWRGGVDCVLGGIPCQPHSVAGKRLGRDDPRDLWGVFRRIVVQSGAWLCAVENVPGMLSSGGAERVWRDLRRLGFAVEGGLFRAAEVGATHERERLFILAAHWGRYRARMADAAGERRGEGRPEPGVWRGRDAAAGHGGAMANADVAEFRREPSAGELALLQSHDGYGCCDLGDALCGGCDGRAHDPLGPALGRGADQGAGAGIGARPIFPPGPGDVAGWRRVIAAAPELEPAVCRVADGLAAGLDEARIDRLRLLGNGVVPLAAGYALRALWHAHAARGNVRADEFILRVEHYGV